MVVWAATAEARGLSYPNAVAVGGRRMGKIRSRSLGRRTRWVIGALGSGTICLPQHASPSVQKAVQAEALNKKVLSRAPCPTSLLRGETYMYTW